MILAGWRDAPRGASPNGTRSGLDRPRIAHDVGDDKSKYTLEELKSWLGFHNDAVMTALLLVFGVDLIAKGLGVLA